MQAADGNFYGTAENGGTNGGWGTVFRTTPAGVITPLVSFDYTNGGIPVAGLVQDTDGTFYGTTYYGGTNGAGSVFKMAADGTLTSLYSFSGDADGSNPFGGLLLSRDGNLYGTTESGGAYGYGTVFRMSPDGTLVTLAHFDGYQGANPEGALVQGADGNLYGTTAQRRPGRRRRHLPPQHQFPAPNHPATPAAIGFPRRYRLSSASRPSAACPSPTSGGRMA